MKDHIGIAEKLNRESILRSGGALLRSRPNCRIGIERESLRCTACGMLSEAAHPASLGGKDDNPYITTDWAESQIELITPPCESPAAAHRFLEMLTDIVLRELAPPAGAALAALHAVPASGCRAHRVRPL